MRAIAFYDSRSEYGILQSLEPYGMNLIEYDEYEPENNIEVFEDYPAKPDVLFVLGDRLHQLEAVYQAKRHGLKIVHHHCGDWSDHPDDNTRMAISWMADLLLPASKMSLERLIEFALDFNGVPIFNEGSLAIDACVGVPRVAGQSGYDNLVLLNPDPHEPKIRPIYDLLHDKRTLWVGANPDNGRDKIHEFCKSMDFQATINFVENLPRADFLKVIADPKVHCIGNSSAFYIEGSYFKLKEEKRFTPIGTRNNCRQYGGYGEGGTAERIVKLIKEYFGKAK